ncbi:hypothetical protein [Luteimonas sp. 100069]|uniref:hypothetical protein n=1 Tax=Luteimonas sp. 100069 TaxID=2006109 RepID=UPI001F404A78|nr:hypothetical protein [Luteimonas sp. 100069]
MQLHAGRHQRLLQGLQIPQVVTIVEEARQAIVAALHDVLRNVGQIEAGQASHSGQRGTPDAARASVDSAEGWPIKRSTRRGK